MVTRGRTYADVANADDALAKRVVVVHPQGDLGHVVAVREGQVHDAGAGTATPEAGVLPEAAAVAAAVAAVDRAGRCPVAAGPCQHDDHCWDQSATQMISRDVNTHSR